MKTYRRILVPLPAGARSELVLQRAADLAQAQRTQLLVVHLIDTRSGFEPDGPAARLPGETAARRAPELMKRLDLQLARNNLGWAESRVAWGEPREVMARIVREWRPDLVVAVAGDVTHTVADGADVLSVRAGGGLLRRLAEAFQTHSPRHA